MILYTLHVAGIFPRAIPTYGVLPYSMLSHQHVYIDVERPFYPLYHHWRIALNVQNWC